MIGKTTVALTAAYRTAVGMPHSSHLTCCLECHLKMDVSLLP
jgi:hypothetical protein